MFEVDCANPVLIINPSLGDIIPRCCYMYIDGVRYNITPDIRGKVLAGDSPSRLLHLPFVTQPKRKPEYTDGEWHAMESRFMEYLDSSYFVSPDGECFPIWQFVPCGKCEICQGKKLYSYVQRAQFAYEQSESPAYFVTLTYNSQHHPDSPNRRDIQLFFKKLRRNIKLLGYDSDIDFIYASERGKDGHLHFHVVLFGMPVISPTWKPERLSGVIQLIRFSWRDSERISDGKWRSFDSYCKVFPKIFKVPKGYDSYSKGYVNVEELDGLKVVGYVLKYSTKDYELKHRLFMEGDMHVEVEPYEFAVLRNQKFLLQDSDDVHFIGRSCNMGIDFVKKHLDDFINSRDGQVEYMSRISGELVKVHLSNYYIKKLLPSWNVLVPIKYRRAVLGVAVACQHLIDHSHSSGFIRSAAARTQIWVMEKYSLGLLDFTIDSKPDKCVGVSDFYDKIASLEIYELLDYVARQVDYLLKNPIDFEKVQQMIVRRSLFFSKLSPRSRDDINQRARKLVQQRKDLIARRKL